MAAGKLALLLVASGLAGAAFAGMNSGAMHPYRNHEAAAPVRPVQPPAEDTTPYAAPPRPSWLDEGISMLDAPAWPFDHETDPRLDQGSAGPGAIAEDYQDYPAYAYEPRRRRDEADFDGYGPGTYLPADPPYDAEEPGDPRHLQRQRPTPRRSDAAGDAASRAADAAQDVMAAEGGHEAVSKDSN